MTGPVDWTLLLFLLGAVVGAAGVGAFAAWWVGQLKQELSDDAAQKIGETQRAADEQIERLAKEVTAFKLEVAQTYATKAGVRDGMDRVVDELKGLRIDTKEGIAGLRDETREGLDKLGDRIVRMENHVLSGRT
jgi:hypothetical protein